MKSQELQHLLKDSRHKRIREVFMREMVSVILINYNGKDYNDACIASILNSTVKESIQIVVVDNASTDDSLLLLREKWGNNKQIHIITLDGNYGFSRANNEGIRWSMAQGIKQYLLLNNDTEISHDTIEQMLSCGQEEKCIVVPKVLYAGKRDVIWCAGGGFTPVIRKAIQRGLNQKDEGQFDLAQDCLFANGCAFLLSKEIVEQMGYMDERFFLYYEDVEYSMRAAAAGITIRYCADAVVYHKVNGATGGNANPANAYYITRNWLLCNSLSMWDCGKKAGKLQFLLFLIYFTINRSVWLLIWFCQGKRGMCVALLKGLRDYRRKKWGKYTG